MECEVQMHQISESPNSAHFFPYSLTLNLAWPITFFLFSIRYVKDLMAHMTSSLVDLANNSDLKNLAQQPDIIMLVRKNNTWKHRFSDFTILINRSFLSNFVLGELRVRTASWSSKCHWTPDTESNIWDGLVCYESCAPSSRGLQTRGIVQGL